MAKGNGLNPVAQVGHSVQHSESQIEEASKENATKTSGDKKVPEDHTKKEAAFKCPILRQNLPKIEIFSSNTKLSTIINLFRYLSQLSLSSHIIVGKQLALDDRHPGRIKTTDLLFTTYPTTSATDIGNNLSLDCTKFQEYYIHGLRARGLKFCFNSKISKVRDDSVLIMCVLINP